MREKLKLLSSNMPMVLLLGMVCLSTPAYALTDAHGNALSATQAEAQLQAVLKEYCIPPEGHNCDPKTLAQHTSVYVNLNGKENVACLCNTPGYFWVSSSRTCQIPVCNAGQEVIADVNCGAGGELVQ